MRGIARLATADGRDACGAGLAAIGKPKRAASRGRGIQALRRSRRWRRVASRSAAATIAAVIARTITTPMAVVVARFAVVVAALAVQAAAMRAGCWRQQHEQPKQRGQKQGSQLLVHIALP